MKAFVWLDHHERDTEMLCLCFDGRERRGRHAERVTLPGDVALALGHGGPRATPSGDQRVGWASRVHAVDYCGIAVCSMRRPNRSKSDEAFGSTRTSHSSSRPTGSDFLNRTVGLPTCAALGISYCIASGLSP